MERWGGGGRYSHIKVRCSSYLLGVENAVLVPLRWGGGGGRYSHIKVRGCSSYLLGVENAVLVPLRVFSFKNSSVVAFVVPLRAEIR